LRLLWHYRTTMPISWNRILSKFSPFHVQCFWHTHSWTVYIRLHDLTYCYTGANKIRYCDFKPSFSSFCPMF
jgi:hypothetical protein